MHFGPPLVAIIDFVFQEGNRAATLRLTARPPKAILESYLAFGDFTRACADEARHWMARLAL